MRTPVKRIVAAVGTWVVSVGLGANIGLIVQTAQPGKHHHPVLVWTLVGIGIGLVFGLLAAAYPFEDD